MTLTVVTVTRNAEATLERTLKSVRRQTYPHLEHIVVDGASSDGTIALIRQYADRLKWVSEPDRGLYDAMNKALGMASGDYLCFLNAGDAFHAPDTVERIMEGAPADILYGETAIVDDRGAFLHMRRLKAPGTLTPDSFKQGMTVCHQAFIVKRALAEPYDLSYRFSSDFDWCLRMTQKAASVRNTRLILVDYLSEGMTTANRLASLKERYRIMARHYGRASTLLHHLWFAVRAVVTYGR
jgi:glycosyltransferase involved in cell wall biosynthesis